MSRQAIGLMETVGLAAGIEAADAALKSANVDLIGYELTKGGGMVTIKIAGDVGSVKAGLEAGVAAAKRVGKVWSQLIIARPHEDLDFLIKSPETVGVKAIPPEQATPVQVEEEKKPQGGELEENAGEENPPNNSWDLEKVRKMVGFDEETEPTCNLCHDPDCPRQRGEAKIKCIHYDPENHDK